MTKVIGDVQVGPANEAEARAAAVSGSQQQVAKTIVNPVPEKLYERGLAPAPVTMQSYADQVNLLSQAQDLYLQRQLSSRTNVLPGDLIRDAPATSLDLLFSRVDQYGLDLLGRYLGRAYPWLKQATGVDGLFAAAFGHALQIPDHNLRGRAVQLVEAMAQSSHPLGPGPAGQAPLPFNPVLEFTFEGQDVRLGLDPTGRFPVLIQTPDKAKAEELNQILSWLIPRHEGQAPNIQPQGFNPINVAVGLFGVGMDAVKAPFSLVAKSTSGVSAEAGQALEGVPGGHVTRVVTGGVGAVGSEAGHLASQGLEKFGTGVSRAGDVIGGSFAGGLEVLGGLAGLRNPRGQSAVVSPSEFLHTYVWPDHPGTGIGNAINFAYGVRPSDPQWDHNMEIGNFVGSWAVLSSTQGSLHAAKLARTGPPFPSEVIAERFGPMARVVYDFLSDGGPRLRTARPGEGWLKSRSGRAFLDDVNRIVTKADNPAAELQRATGMPEPLAARMSKYGTKAEWTQQFVDYVAGKRDAVEMARLKAARLGVDDALRAGVDDGVERASLITERLRIDHALRVPPKIEPVWEWPKPSAMRRIVNNVPRNDFERSMAVLYDPGIKFAHFPGALNVSRVFDTMGSTKVFNWLRSDAPADARTHNAELIQTWMKRAGVPEEYIKRAIGGMDTVLTDTDFYQWAKDVGEITRNEARGLYPAHRDEMGTLWGREATEQHRAEIETVSTVDGVDYRSYTGFIPRKRWNPIENRYEVGYGPSISAEFADHFYLPSVDRLRQATSSVQNVLRIAKERGGGAAKTARLVDMLEAGNGLATAVLKPTILGARAPALIFRTQLEQILRNEASGYKGAVLHPYEAELRLPFGDESVTVEFGKQYTDRGIFLPRDRSQLGTLLREQMERPGTRRWTEFETWKPGPDGTILPTADVAAYRDGIAFQIIKAFKSPEVRVMVARRGNTEGWLKWLDSDAPAAIDTKLRIGAELEQSTWVADEGLSMEQAWKRYAEGIKEWTEQLTGGREDLKRAIATGEWRVVERRAARTPQGIIEGTGQTGEQAALQGQAQEADRLYQRAIESGDEFEIRSALVAKRELAQRERFLTLKNRNKVRHIDIHDTEQMGAALRKAVEDGYHPPRKVGGFEYVPSAQEGVRQISASVSRRLYRGIGPFSVTRAGQADVALTRGSLYFQVAKEEYERLVNLGWSKGEARRIAQTRGARVTADRMYDLAGRTSAQRFLRNASYFSAAWQELLTTWLWKIPSDSYWLPGAAVLATRAKLIHGLFKGIGIIKTDANGDEIVPIPGLASALSKLGGVPGLQALKTLDPAIVNDIVSFKARGVNLISQGWPSLSPQGAAVLNLAAKHYSAVAGIANALNQADMDTTLWPAAFNYLYEAITGDSSPFEFLSPSQQQKFHDAAYDDAIKQAWVQVGPPPRLEDFSADGKVNQDGLRKATDKWRTSVMEEAKQIYKGWAFVRALGSMASIAALHVTDTYKDQADRFYQGMFAKEPPKGTPEHDMWSQDIRSWIDQYTADHPDSYAYFVGKSLLGEKVDDPVYAPGGDNEIFAKYYTGELRVANPEEFINKVFYNEARRHFFATQQQQLDGIGTTAPDLLTKGYTRHEVLDENRLEWEGWKATFPAVSGQQEEQFQRWARQNNVKSESAFTEALLTSAALLNSLAISQAGGGTRDVDYRKVAGDLKSLWYDAAQPGSPRSETAQGMAWYSDNVLGPYFDEIGKLYDQARKVSAAGGNPGPLYDQIKAIKNKWAGQNLTYGGQTYPNPEEVTWGNLSPAEQDERSTALASRPVSWLTGFERDKAGYQQVGPEVDAMFSQVGALEAEFARRNRGISHNSNAWQSARSQLDAQEASLAGRFGPQAAQMFYLDRATPIERLNVVGFGKGNGPWQRAVAAARQIGRQIEAQGYSPAGYSQYAVGLKQWFYGTLASARRSDPQGFGDLLDSVGLAMHFAGRDYVAGPLLYNALFFGGFDPHIPDSLLTSTPVGGTGTVGGVGGTVVTPVGG